jgi:hypothetical protein
LSTDHRCPSHRSISAAVIELSAVGEESPTAKHRRALVHDTDSSSLVAAFTAFGLGSTDHRWPSHRSISVFHCS